MLLLLGRECRAICCYTAALLERECHAAAILLKRECRATAILLECECRAIATAGTRMPRYCYCWNANAALLLLLERECRATATATAINTVMQDAKATLLLLLPLLLTNIVFP